MNWPQITIIVLWAIGAYEALIDHGKPKDGKHNFYVTLASTGIGIFVLYSGGFFK